MEPNGDVLMKIAEVSGLLAAVSIINRWMNYGLRKEIEHLKKKHEVPSRSIPDCERLYEKCPTHENIRTITETMKRYEDKVDQRFDRLEQKFDRLIERK